MRLSVRQTIAIILAAAVTLSACSSSGSTPVSPAEQSGPQPAGVAVGLEKGQRAPSFTVTGLDGRQISDADLRGAGKPYILYFYATW